jgi:coenzyme F420 hydrogenase subunit beta
VAVVGTPCVIAGIRAIQKNQPGFFISEIVLTISNFCGGFKSFKNISRLAEIHHVDYRSLKDFRYRGGGQPGSLRFVTNDGKEASTPYPQYVGLTGESKMLRCHLCVDATGELADIACGDAWIPKFEKDKYPWSVILSRSSIGTSIIREMERKDLIALSDMTLEEVKLSQRFNLKSKKNRQAARMKLYKMLGYKVPEFDGGYYCEPTDITTEIKVYFTHRIKSFLEKVRLYHAVYGHFKAK